MVQTAPVLTHPSSMFILYATIAVPAQMSSCLPRHVQSEGERHATLSARAGAGRFGAAITRPPTATAAAAQQATLPVKSARDKAVREPLAASAAAADATSVATPSTSTGSEVAGISADCGAAASPAPATTAAGAHGGPAPQEQEEGDDVAHATASCRLARGGAPYSTSPTIG
eukprot:538478-Prymnesium_polylepis.1